MRSRTERGAILVQVALSMAVLCGFAALAVDYGMLWTARAQAQNAADAGALAGATVLAFDSVVDAARIQDSAESLAAGNLVWADPPVAEAEALMDPACTVPGVPAPPSRIYTCVRVNVYRNQEMGNPLPAVFSGVVDVAGQGVRAQAIGTAAPANTSSCVWPIALPDKWQERYPAAAAWTPGSTFVKYDPYPAAVATPDVYIQPTAAAPGSGFSLAVALLNMNLSVAMTPADPLLPIAGSQFVPVEIPRAGGGDFSDNLESCNGQPISIGTVLARDPAGTLAAVRAAAQARIAMDAAATWNNAALRIQNSCAGAEPPCAAMSPRLVLLPLFDVERYEESRLLGAAEIEIVNFLGFFIREVTATEVVGNASTYPGQIDPDQPFVTYQSSFLRAPVLHR